MDSTYNYANKIVHELENKGFVALNMVGRKFHLALTPKGLKLYAILVSVNDILPFEEQNE